MRTTKRYLGWKPRENRKQGSVATKSRNSLLMAAIKLVLYVFSSDILTMDHQPSTIKWDHEPWHHGLPLRRRQPSFETNGTPTRKRIDFTVHCTIVSVQIPRCLTRVPRPLPSVGGDGRIRNEGLLFATWVSESIVTDFHPLRQSFEGISLHPVVQRDCSSWRSSARWRLDSDGPSFEYVIESERKF
jgi:hypothetical protein